MKTANLKLEKQAPGTLFELTITMGDTYSMTGKEVEFEIVKAGEVVFRYRSGVDAQLDITGQVITFLIEPDTDSLDSLGYTLDQAVALGDPSVAGTLLYNIDVGVTGSARTDYRFQGNFDTLVEHGPF